MWYHNVEHKPCVEMLSLKMKLHHLSRRNFVKTVYGETLQPAPGKTELSVIGLKLLNTIPCMKE